MSEPADRDRAINAYAAEVHAFHTLLGAVLIALGAFHLLALVPYLQIRAALPAISGSIAAAQAQIRSAEDAQRAVEAADSGLAPLRQALATGPDRLRRAISDLVTRGRAVAGPNGDPYKASIKVPKEGTPPGAPEDETITVDEAVRRQIGKDIEAVIMTFDQAMEPLRSIKSLPPDVESLLRETQASVGRDLVSLNEILRQAFDADPNFWKRWERSGATFAAASPRAEETMRRIDSALRALTKGLANASLQAKSHQQEGQARIETLRVKQDDLKERTAKTGEFFGRFTLGLDETTRSYPLVAGAFAVTVLVRLRRLLALRRALGGVDLDLIAPSWVIGSASSPGRWWALALIAAPLIAMIHASVAAVRDPGLFTTILGDQNQAMFIGYAAAYALLAAFGLVQLLTAFRGLMGAAPAPRPQQGAPKKGGKG